MAHGTDCQCGWIFTRTSKSLASGMSRPSIGICIEICLHKVCYASVYSAAANAMPLSTGALDYDDIYTDEWSVLYFLPSI